MADDDEDGGGGGLSRRTLIFAGAYAALLLVVGLLVVVPTLGNDDADDDPGRQVAAAAGGNEAGASTGTDDAEPAAVTLPGDGSTATSTDPPVTEVPATVPETTSPEPVDTEPAVTVSATAVSTTAAPTTSTTELVTTEPKSYETLADGTPVPIVAVFDGPTITLTGTVPSQAAAERLSALAMANSKVPATVVNQMSINPAVPVNVGVRVIEMQSARFPEGTATITPEHALELDRVVWVMSTLPNITALVIGHADQRGDELANFVLSEDRARAVTTYLASRGIAPTRLSSRAVGEAELLSLENDAAAFALNRRTEFIFYGLLIE